MDHEENSAGKVVNAVVGGAEQIVQARDVAGDIHVHASSSSEIPQPRQLPPTVTHFTGRDAELGILDTLLGNTGSGRPSAVVISAIAGAAGIGKTSLAVRWAHRVKDQFPDGQLHVNLRGYDSGPPLTAHHVLDSFLRALGVPAERIPPEVDAKAGLYRSVLAGRRMLVVLDNAAAPDQVRPLLPSEAGCMVVVTSRSRLSGLVARDGAHRISLDVLAPDDAYALLREIIGRTRADHEPQATAELARSCAHLPLALRIAAERIADRPHLSVADLVQELAGEHDRLDVLAADDDESTAVRTVFSWSYHALPDQAARVFRLLGLHPGSSISLPSATALTGATTADTQRLLAVLTGVHLLTEIGRDRYQFHDLLRDYAAERSADEPVHKREDATGRLFQWYLHTAHAALFAFYPQHPEIPIDPRPLDCHPLTFADSDHARTWFTAEHANLMAIIRRAPTVGQHTVGWQLPNAVDCYLADHHHVADQIAVHRLGLAAAQHLGHQLGQRWAHGHLGEALWGERRYDDAIVHHQQALTIGRSIGNRFGEASALGDLGHVYNELGRYREAADHSRQALDIVREIGHQRNQAVNLTNLGNALRGMGDLDQALTHLRQGLNIFIAIGATGGQAWPLRCIAKVYHQQGHSDHAVDCLRQAAALHLQYAGPGTYSYAVTLGDLGTVLNDIGRPLEARDAWNEALSILTDLDPHQADQIREHLNALGPTENNSSE
ncbi:ATP-binding protein [Amycolatopsis circi]|uniref:ATP-binding protein n=1 Tax=Amycolatopsis circi TaxID=871959 RepID=UPI0013BE8B2E|nr:tetratricopeptide repeat protein [Amycolatopsis circi]